MNQTCRVSCGSGPAATASKPLPSLIHTIRMTSRQRPGVNRDGARLLSTGNNQIAFFRSFTSALAVKANIAPSGDQQILAWLNSRSKGYVRSPFSFDPSRLETNREAFLVA